MVRRADILAVQLMLARGDLAAEFEFFELTEIVIPSPETLLAFGLFGIGDSRDCSQDMLARRGGTPKRKRK